MCAKEKGARIEAQESEVNEIFIDKVDVILLLYSLLVNVLLDSTALIIPSISRIFPRPGRVHL